MALQVQIFKDLQQAAPAKAWSAVLNTAWDICSQPVTASSPGTEIERRDRAIADIDLLLAT